MRRQRRSNWLLFAPSWAQHPGARLLVALLALVQFVAPSWHVCDMGGATCHEHQAGRPACHAHLADAAGEAHEAAEAPCRCPEEHATSASGPALQSPPEANPFNESCLARLLLGLPGSLPSIPPLIDMVAQRAISTPHLKSLSSFSPVRQRGRAPPLFT